jgi:ABC-type bacteriocin/lantibiotic exporter with double-glycine peptidase domain
MPGARFSGCAQWQNLLLTKSGQSLDLTLILSYYRHLFTLPQTFFDGMRVGEMVSRINDAVKIRTFLNQQGATFITSALTLVLAVLVMFVFSLQLALLSLAFLAIYSILFVFAIWRNRTDSRDVLWNNLLTSTRRSSINRDGIHAPAFRPPVDRRDEDREPACASP